MLQSQLNRSSETHSEMKTLLEQKASKIHYLEKALRKQSRDVSTSSLDFNSGSVDTVCECYNRLSAATDITCSI